MPDTLANYPYVVVNVRCRLCSRQGSYRLAKLADRYGAWMSTPALLEALAGDCKYWGRPRHPILPGCGAYFCDLDPPRRPPDLPPRRVRLRVVGG